MEKKKRSIWKKILIALLVIILIVVITFSVLAIIGYNYMNSKLEKIQQVEIPVEELQVSEQVEEKYKEKYRNIAIFGVDSRSSNLGKGNRSDCIIIASINNETKEVRLASVYRDTYVQIEGHGLDKINHAYSYGEAPLAIKTLNTNLDLNIKEFVTVNFDAVTEVVDALGGIEMDITSAETKYINKYIKETSRVTGKQSDYITEAGHYTLDGVQAVSYSRIRYTEGGDYKRTERMRDVVEAIANKLKTKSIAEIDEIIDIVLPKIYTNIPVEEIISFIPTAMNYKMGNSLGWPYNTKGITLDRWYGVPVTLETNVMDLHHDLFEDSEYEPSDFVKEVDEKIIRKTGYT